MLGKSKFISLLREKAGGRGVKIALTAVMAGFLQGLVMVIINGAAENFPEGGLNFRYFVMFVLCISAFIYTKRYALSQNVYVVQEIIFETRVRISDKIRRSALVSIENIGRTEIYTTLTENTEIILEASKRLANACSSVVMITFSFLYIGYLSSMALAISAVLIAAAVSIYLGTQKSISEMLMETTRRETEFFDYLQHILDGFKEVKMNTEKSDDLFENHLKGVSTTAKNLRVDSEIQFVNNFLFSQGFFFVLMACIIFLLPRISSVEPGVIINVIAVILFMIGPLGDLVEAMPLVAKADVAVERLEILEKVLDEADDSKENLPSTRLSRKRDFEAIRLSRVTFNHTDPRGKPTFSLSDIDLTIHAGEVLFIVGGNGSGKSTLLKIVTALYYPASGSIFVDDVPVDRTNAHHYRDLFSIIFTDFHLFDRLYGLKDVNEDRVLELIDQMELAEKTSFEDGRFTNINLSTGQKKRLALIASYMEDKSVFVFDEVAADQDPRFRKHFYEVLLKDLQRQGKTVIAVTHDDRYFHVADRVLKMEYGRIAPREPGDKLFR